MSRDFLPRQDVQLVDETGRASNPFYVWLQSLDAVLKSGATIPQIEAKLAELQALIDSIPTSGFLPNTTNVFGQNSIATFGTLANGIVLVQLQGDAPSPYPLQFYGVDSDRVRGWQWIHDALAAGDGLVRTMDGFNVLGVLPWTDDLPVSADTGDAYIVQGTLWAWDGATWNDEGDASGVTMFALAPLPDTGEGALLAITRDQYGRVEGSKPATITGTAGQIDVANGDAVAGLPTISLADLADAGGGTFKLLTRDAKGRLSGTSDGDTDDVPEGATNLYFTAARVLGTVLAGLSTATNAAITAADSVLAAFGKLQAQITALVASLSGYVNTTTNQTVGGVKTFTGNPRVSNTAPQLYLDETDTAKTWVAFAQTSTFFISEDSPAGGNSRLRIRAGSSELDLAVGNLLYGGNVVWNAGNMPLASGTYTPTATGVANVASVTGALSTYLRVGNSITLSGRIDVTPTAAGILTTADISIPVNSNFTAATQASGAAAWNQGASVLGAGFINSGGGANALRVAFIPANTGSHTIRYSITYPVL